MKLYDYNSELNLSSVVDKKLHTITEEISLDTEIKQLTTNIKAYKSLSIVNEAITVENYNLIDKHNYVIYNEYIKAITANLDVEYIPTIAQETVELLPTTALNHHIALEGFLANMWEKIKKIFISLYEKVKKLFVTYFTRLGRLEKKLTNIAEVLEEMPSDIGLKKSSIEKVPSSLQNKYPFHDVIGLAEIDKIFGNVKVVYTSFKDTLAISKEFTNKDILDKDFIENLKNLKEKSKELQDRKKAAEDEKDKTWAFTKAHKEVNEKIESISDEIKETNKEISNEKDEVNKIVGSNIDLPDLAESDKKFEIIKKEFDSYLKDVSAALEKVKGKELTGGKVIKEIKLSKDDIDVDIDNNDKENVTMVTLADKENLLKLIKESLDILSDLKKTMKTYAEVNDNIYKQTDIVNNLIYDLDKVSDDVNGKYKTILQNKVKERLALLKEFFSLYNKVNKLVSDVMVESLEGNADYSTLCLKYYG